MGTLGIRNANWLAPPRAGQVSNISVSTSAGSQDMTLVGNQTRSLANQWQNTTGAMGKIVIIYADGADVGVVFGPNQAAVTGGNAPSLAANGVNVTGGCARIPNGQRRAFELSAGMDNWLGFVASASGTMRIEVTGAP